jgi:nitrogen fixation/metabolism regulation signal transduction histidine kinase
MSYAGGALYLFSINAVFIALSTFLVAKILRFPLVRYANSKRRRVIAQLASVIALVVIVPSIYLFVNLLSEQVFETKTKEFVNNVIQYDGAEVVKFTQDYEQKNIDIYLIGKPVPQSQITEWAEQLATTSKLEQCNLRIYQGTDRSGELAAQISGDLKTDILEELYVKNETAIRDKDERIRFLENEVARLKVKEQITFKDVSDEVKLLYPSLEAMSYAERETTNFDEKLDTIAVFNLKWNENVRKRERDANNELLASWLKFKMKLVTLQIV